MIPGVPATALRGGGYREGVSSPTTSGQAEPALDRATEAAPLTQFIASYSSPEGLFYAKLSAASTMAIAPILILGWFSQKQLVRGLTFGAVK